MANYVKIQEMPDGPCGQAGTSPVGGAWSASTYSFLIVAWDDPNETDISLARYDNTALRLNSGASDSIVYSKVNGLVVSANDKVYLSWTPPRRIPHHYAVYFQQAATYTLTSVGSKLTRPVTSASVALANGLIPGTATEVYFDTGTSDAIVRYAPILTTAANLVYLRGNWLGMIDTVTPGTVTEFPSGTSRTVSGLATQWGIQGEMTRVGITDGPTASQTNLGLAGNAINAWVSREGIVALQPTSGLTTQPKDHLVQDINGRYVNRSFIGKCPDAAITLEVQYTELAMSTPDVITTFTNTGGAMVHCRKWQENGKRLLAQVYDSTDSYITHIWLGYIQHVNDMNLPEVSNFNSVEIQFMPERYYNTNHVFDTRKITAVSTGSKTFTIQGPAHPSMVAGAHIWVKGSTGNDGLYVLSSAAFTAPSTVLTVTTAPPDATADGILWVDDLG